MGMCIKRLFWPPMRLKYEKCFSPICSYQFIRTIIKVFRSRITFTFTVAMVTKMAAEIGNWPFWSKFDRFDGEINIEQNKYKKKYFNRR